ncbi:MAG: WYL domain-containing protein [Pyrinomonadaceae bacterium]
MSTRRIKLSLTTAQRNDGVIFWSAMAERSGDRRLRIRMTVTALDRVKRFVMRYGSHARVIGPKKLREEIHEDLL